MKRKIRLLLVDDQQLFVESLEYVFKSLASDIEVVGIAYDGLEAVEVAGMVEPDVILMDVRMPKMDGVEAARILHYKMPHIHVVMLTTFQDDEYVHFALKYGAAGYLLKNMPPADLVAAVRTVMSGAKLFAEDVATALIQGESPSDRLESIASSLSKREMEVLQLVLKPMNNRQIAKELGVAEQSVRNYISSIYSKFGINDRMQLIQTLKRAWPYIEKADADREA